MEESQYKLIDVKYHHIVIEGSHYEIGKQLAELLSQEPNAKQMHVSAKVNLKKLGFKDFETLWSYCEECAPGVIDEIQGFADGMEVSPQNLPFWNWTFTPSLGGECSQFAILSPTTKDHQIYAGRTYEWIHTEEDLKLFTTRVKGKADHIGFSCLLFGRHDGINEHGLVVSMTGGGIFGVPFKHRGPMFWLAIRAVLDRCTSVETALAHLETQPMTGYFTLMLVDKKDNAALVEFADGTMSVKQITSDNPEPYVFSVNHFRQPDMEQFNKRNASIIHHSKIREGLITSWYAKHAGKITRQDVQNLLVTEHPEGLCNHYYNDYFGTLWSMIFNVTQQSVDVCFSAPTHNEYRTFGLKGPVGIAEYPSIVPITKARL
ncbi:MAG: C45 family peptidase [Candidatus Hermodarchaeota archaeon]|nr:C45 family peptidase [Candidatus Hermodarchaeota archaeon]